MYTVNGKSSIVRKGDLTSAVFEYLLEQDR